MSKKVAVGHHELKKIQDLALVEFHKTMHTPEDSRDTQVFLILKGFHSFLISQGIDPQFTVKPAKEEPGDCTPIDDL